MFKDLHERKLYSKFQGDEYYENLVKEAGLLYRDKNPLNFLLQKFDYKGPAIVTFMLGAVVSTLVFLNKLPASEDQLGLMMNCLMIPVISYLFGFLITLGYIAYLAVLENTVLIPAIEEVSNDMELRVSLSKALDRWASTLEEEKSKIGNDGYSYIFKVCDLISSIQDTSAKLKNAESGDIKKDVEKVFYGFDSYGSYSNQILKINDQDVKTFGGF